MACFLANEVRQLSRITWKEAGRIETVLAPGKWQQDGLVLAVSPYGSLTRQCGMVDDDSHFAHEMHFKISTCVFVRIRWFRPRSVDSIIPDLKGSSARLGSLSRDLHRPGSHFDYLTHKYTYCKRLRRYSPGILSSGAHALACLAAWPKNNPVPNRSACASRLFRDSFGMQ